MNLHQKITELKRQKNAVILAHYYQVPEIQQVADYVGDSLGLSQKAAETDAEIIVFAGVHFMAETAKILNSTKKVLLPDLMAGCSLADSCQADSFRKLVSDYKAEHGKIDDTFKERLQVWYNNDKGISIVNDILDRKVGS